MVHQKPRILVVGSFVMDVIATTEQIPGPGQTVYGKSFHTAPGGKGANQALQCARLGAEVTMVGCVGDDLFGRQLLEPLQNAGVDTGHVIVRSDCHSGVGHVTLAVSGHTAQNRIIVIPGANLTLKASEVSWLREQIAEYDLVLLQLEIPLEVNLAVARFAREAGVPAILNPAPAAELDDTLLSLVSWLIPNEQEASQETHLPLRIGNRPSGRGPSGHCRSTARQGRRTYGHHTWGLRLRCGGAIRPPVHPLRPHGARSRPHRSRGLLCGSSVRWAFHRPFSGRCADLCQPHRRHHGLPSGRHALPSHAGRGSNPDAGAWQHS